MSEQCANCGKRLPSFGGCYQLSQNSGYKLCYNCQDKVKKYLNSDVEVGVEALRKENLTDEAIEYYRQCKVVIDKYEESTAEKTDYEQGQEKIEMEAANIMATTSNSFDGYTIVKYIDVISEETIMGTGLIKGISIALNSLSSSIMGTEYDKLTEKLNEVKNMSKQKLKSKAYRMGANAVLAIDYESSFPSADVIMVSVSGTAVVVEKSK